MDKVEQFTETVYTCVLKTTSPQGLTMFPPRDLQGATRFPLAESPGRAFSYTDKARYEWEHGVPLITAGERISISWRFFKDTRRSPSISGPRPPKMPKVSLGSERKQPMSFSLASATASEPCLWRPTAFGQARSRPLHGKFSPTQQRLLSITSRGTTIVGISETSQTNCWYGF